MSERERMTFANPGEWAERAACKGETVAMEIPPGHRPSKISAEARERIYRARSICLACPVLDPCREWAMTSPDPAYQLMAGGLTPDERNYRRADAGIDIRSRSPLKVGVIRRAPEPDHGTRNKYRRGCHCNDCRAANTSYVRSLKETS